jgi:hypothetical protein
LFWSFPCAHCYTHKYFLPFFCETNHLGFQIIASDSPEESGGKNIILEAVKADPQFNTLLHDLFSFSQLFGYSFCFQLLQSIPIFFFFSPLQLCRLKLDIWSIGSSSKALAHELQSLLASSPASVSNPAPTSLVLIDRVAPSLTKKNLALLTFLFPPLDP